MAREINCDLCSSEPAALIVSSTSDGKTTAVGSNCAAGFFAIMGGTPSPEACDICKQEMPRYTWTDHATGDTLSAGESCVVAFVAGLAESLGLSVAMPATPDAQEDEVSPANATEAHGQPGTVPESASARTGRKRGAQRAAVDTQATSEGGDSVERGDVELSNAT